MGGLGLILEVDRLALRNMAKAAVSGNRVKKIFKKKLKGKKKSKGGIRREGEVEIAGLSLSCFFQKEN